MQKRLCGFAFAVNCMQSQCSQVYNIGIDL